MAKKEAEKKVAKRAARDDAATDDSVEGHVNLQPQNAQDGPNKKVGRRVQR